MPEQTNGKWLLFVMLAALTCVLIASVMSLLVAGALTRYPAVITSLTAAILIAAVMRMLLRQEDRARTAAEDRLLEYLDRQSAPPSVQAGLDLVTGTRMAELRGRAGYPAERFEIRMMAGLRALLTLLLELNGFNADEVLERWKDQKAAGVCAEGQGPTPAVAVVKNGRGHTASRPSGHPFV